jgi:hypothetical protein
LGSYSCFAQTANEQVTQLPNGVIVHPCIGNEGYVPTSSNVSSTVEIRTVTDWSLAECIDALRVIDEKCLMLSVQECSTYDSLKNSIQQRIHELNQ